MLGGFYFFKKKKIHYLSELLHIKIIGLQFKTKDRKCSPEVLPTD